MDGAALEFAGGKIGRAVFGWVVHAGAAARSRKAAAFSVATALHLLLFLLAFAELSGAVIPNAGDPLEETDVVLVTLSGRTPHPVAQSAALLARFDQLLARIEAERGSDQLSKDRQSATPAQHNDLEHLMASLGDNAPPSASKGEGAAALDRGGHADLDSLLAPSSAKAKSGGAPSEAKSASASSGTLWGAIEPCWKRQKGESRVPVTIEIALDGFGQLAKPPTIIRPSGAKLDEARLISEARAIGAIAACAPLHTAQLSANTGSMRVEFRP